MAGADKRQHSVSLNIVIVTVYPELVGGADTFRLIGLALETTFCTFAKLTLAARCSHPLNTGPPPFLMQ